MNHLHFNVDLSGLIWLCFFIYIVARLKMIRRKLYEIESRLPSKENTERNEKEFAADRGAFDCNSWLKRSHCFGGYWRLHSRGLSVPNAESG